MIAHNPLHGSGRAAFPHPALALGNDAHTSQRIGMTDSRHRQPAIEEAPHTIPKDAAVLAPPRQRAMPKPAHSEAKKRQRRLVHGHPVVAEVSTYNRPQPLALFGDGFVHSSLKLGLHLVHLQRRRPGGSFLRGCIPGPYASPVNASTPPSRAAPHDAGPMWVAAPLSYDFCIHYTSPV